MQRCADGGEVALATQQLTAISSALLHGLVVAASVALVVEVGIAIGAIVAEQAGHIRSGVSLPRLPVLGLELLVLEGLLWVAPLLQELLQGMLEGERMACQMASSHLSSVLWRKREVRLAAAGLPSSLILLHLLTWAIGDRGTPRHV